VRKATKITHPYQEDTLFLDSILNFAAHGLIELPWWGYVLASLAFTHITIAAVTIFLHRCQSHRGLDLHAIPSHFFRFWLWLTTGQITKEWVAVHRKHHAKCEKEEDPHSPQVKGIRKVLFEGAELYRLETKNPETTARYGTGTPDDWIERNLYTAHSVMGPTLAFILYFMAFGAIGVAMWAVQMAWIPVTAAGIVNGIGHYWGYRNYDCEDASRNIVPWGILIGGEELHNNHHAYGTSAKFSLRPYEFDLGWQYIRILRALGLCEVRKVAPEVQLAPAERIDFDGLQAIITHRYRVAQGSLKLLKNTWRLEMRALQEKSHASGSRFDASAFRASWSTLKRDATELAAHEKERLQSVLQHSATLEKVYALRQELAVLWSRSNDSREELVARWSAWCERAEASGIPAMVKFSHDLRRYA
jgi:stearoyl-CoA desaturase (Delta-9 desaturase)